MDDIKKTGVFFVLVLLVTFIITGIMLEILSGMTETVFHRIWAVGISVGMAVVGANLALGIIGVLWAPFAAGITGGYAREKGLNVPCYRALGAFYSVHLLFPWLFFISRMSAGNPIVKMPT